MKNSVSKQNQKRKEPLVSSEKSSKRILHPKLAVGTETESIDLDALVRIVSKATKLDETLLNNIYEIVQDSAALGRNIIEIQQLAPATSFSKIEECLYALTARQILHIVGFTHPRYIIHSYLTNWMVHPLEEFDDNGEKIEAVDSFSPQVWMNIDGTKNEKMYRSCHDAVIGLIFHRPGITKRNIFRKVSSVMNEMELHNLLNEMVDKGVIRQLVTNVQKPIEHVLDGIFESDEDHPDYSRTITTYHPLPKWFFVDFSIHL